MNEQLSELNGLTDDFDGTDLEAAPLDAGVLETAPLDATIDTTADYTHETDEQDLLPQDAGDTGITEPGGDDEQQLDMDQSGTGERPSPGGEVRFTGYSGEYNGVPNCWYSSDGKVYDVAGNCVGTH